MVWKLFVLFLVLGFFFSSCQESKAQEDDKPEIQVLTTLYSYEWIALHDRIKDRENVVILDLRSLEEYNLGRVEGAQHLDYNDPNFEEKLDEFEKDKIYLVYSSSGAESGRALDIMYLKNFIEVYDLKEGIASLEELGYNLSENIEE